MTERENLPQWLELTTSPPTKGEELPHVEALRRIGGRGIQRKGDAVVGYFASPPDPESLARRAAGTLAASTSQSAPRVSWRWVSPKDEALLWEAVPRRHISGIEVVPARPERGSPADRDPAVDGGSPADRDPAVDGGSPDDRDPAGADNRTVVRILPGPAFGSAEHATTRGCLRLATHFVRRGSRIADLGAGSGILSIAAARLGADRVIALEKDPVACRAARANVDENAVETLVTVRRVVVSPHTIQRLAPLDGTFANLETGLVLQLLPALARILRPAGWVVASGVPWGERPVVIATAEREGFRLVVEDREDGWWTAGLVRGSAPRPRG